MLSGFKQGGSLARWALGGDLGLGGVAGAKDFQERLLFGSSIRCMVTCQARSVTSMHTVCVVVIVLCLLVMSAGLQSCFVGMSVDLLCTVACS